MYHSGVLMWDMAIYHTKDRAPETANIEPAMSPDCSAAIPIGSSIDVAYPRSV
jgi:hypothetical protein